MHATDLPTTARLLAECGIEATGLAVQHSGPEGEILRFDVGSEAAVPTWKRLRTLADRTGRYPVVCRDEHGTLAELPEINQGSPSEVLAKAATLDPAAWFDEREAEDPELYGEVEEGDWEEQPPHSGWTVPFDLLSGKPVDGVWMSLVPTTVPWEVLAHLRWGGWNECPMPEAHVALHRWWHERYGAEIVCVSGDVVEMRVERPPTTREAAQELAREQFLYTGGDLVYQGHETLNALAASLVDDRVWFFWWD